ncbi:Metal resistance protein YCF1 [Colletotrichum tanaceti]|nr:Metal resistance protein YCF1 [Colletotrichum tanaceti]
MASNAVCPPGSDNQFGPRIDFGCRHFDFTLLFEDAIFHVLPSALFLLLVPFRAHSLWRAPVKLATRRLALWKLGPLAGLAALHSAFLVVQTKTPALCTDVSLAAGVLNLVAVLAATFHSFVEDQRSIRPSDLLVLYFSASTLLSLPRLRTLWLVTSAGAPKALWTVILALTTLVVPLESVGKKKFLRPPYETLTKEEETGFWGRSFFTWLLPFFRVGYSRIIHIRDIPDVDADLTGEVAGEKLKRAWAQREGRRHHALFRANCSAYRGTLVLGVVARLCLTTFTFCQPFLITATVRFMQTPETQTPETQTRPPSESQRYGRALVGACLLTYLGIAVSRAAFSRQQYRFTTMVRAGLTSVVFGRAVSLRADDLRDNAAVTLMGTDVERIVATFVNLHQVWAAVLEVGIAIFLLQRHVAAASVVPVVISIVCALGVIPISKAIGKAQTGWIECLQKRVAVTASMLGDMKAIKMLGLPDVLSTVITELRRIELSGSEKFRKLLVCQILVSIVPVELAPFATFVIYSIIAVTTKEQTLTTTSAFTALSLINLLTEPLLMFCQVVPSVVQGLACLKRIETFCLKDSGVKSGEGVHSDSAFDDDSSKSGVELKSQHLQLKSGDALVLFNDAMISWAPDSDLVFKNLTLTIKRGTITMVTGPVGSGKSCLLESILGETSIGAGTRTFTAHGAAYCPQTPWMMNNTIRHNITGGLEYEPTWLEQVLGLCSLTEDIRNMPEGDLYNAGTNGVGLSGGQRQRVALARAVYSRHRVLILDDVFSGLDSKSVGQISARLFGVDGHFHRSGLSVVLATHTRVLLRYADEVVVLNGGEVTSQGPYKQVLTESSSTTVTKADADTERGDANDEEEEEELAVGGPVRKPGHVQTLLDSEEGRLRRNGSWSVYKYYFERAGWIVVSLFILSSFAEAFCSGFTTIWFQWWVEANEKRPNDNLGKYLGVYALLFAVTCIAICVECWLLFIRIISSTALGLHADLLRTSLRAPLRFFLSTDTGSVTRKSMYISAH